MFGIGAGELVIILIAGLIIFGPKNLPEVGRAIGKGLREFRKAQAAFSATLDEVSDEPKKNSDTENVAQAETVEKKKVVLEKNSGEKKSVNVDDVINLAKESPLNKGNADEKISDGADSVNDDTVDGKRVEPARGGTNGAGKESVTSTHRT